LTRIGRRKRRAAVNDDLRDIRHRGFGELVVAARCGGPVRKRMRLIGERAGSAIPASQSRAQMPRESPRGRATRGGNTKKSREFNRAGIRVGVR
jgi:hypothetical protein